MHIIFFFFLCVPVSVYFAWKDLELKYLVHVTKCYHCWCTGVSEKDDCKRKGLTIGILVGVFDEAIVHDDEGSPVLPATPRYTCTAQQRGNRTCSCHCLLSLLQHQATPLQGDSISTATPHIHMYSSTRGETCQHFSCPVPVSDAHAQFLCLMHLPSSCLWCTHPVPVSDAPAQFLSDTSLTCVWCTHPIPICVWCTCPVPTCVWYCSYLCEWCTCPVPVWVMHLPSSCVWRTSYLCLMHRPSSYLCLLHLLPVSDAPAQFLPVSDAPAQFLLASDAVPTCIWCTCPGPTCVWRTCPVPVSDAPLTGVPVSTCVWCTCPVLTCVWCTCPVPVSDAPLTSVWCTCPVPTCIWCTCPVPTCVWCTCPRPGSEHGMPGSHTTGDLTADPAMTDNDHCTSSSAPPGNRKPFLKIHFKNMHP